jgi:ribosomal-protein-alanine N-acetyltransferase
MMRWQIQPMKKEWLPAAAALECACFSLPWSRQSLHSELSNPRAVMLAAVDEDGALLGWAGFEHVCGEGSITNIAVAPDARRLGIGSALTAALIDAARSLGLLSLTLEVRVSNRAALALYDRLGFETLGVRPRFYERPTEDALMMVRRL